MFVLALSFGGFLLSFQELLLSILNILKSQLIYFPYFWNKLCYFNVDDKSKCKFTKRYKALEITKFAILFQIIVGFNFLECSQRFIT